MKSGITANNDPLSQSRDIESNETASTELSEDAISSGEQLPEHVPETSSKLVDTAPDGGYGWVQVAVCFLINAHTWGLNSSYGVFLAHYLSNNTYPSATALEFAFIGGLSISASQMVAPAATIITRDVGTRYTLLLGIVLQTAALLGASWSTEIYQLFLSQGLCFGLGMGFQFNATVGLIPQWFTKKRSFANAIGAAGSGFGGLAYSLASQKMIDSISVGWAFRILAIVSCSVCSMCAVLLRDRHKAISSVQIAFDLKLLKRPEFILTLGWGAFSMMGYVVLLFSLPSYAASIGLTPSQGSIIGAVLNLGQGVGRPVIGLYSDRVGRLNISSLLTFVTAVFCFAVWIPAQNYGVLIFFALIGGAVCGVFWTTVAPVTAEVVGLQILPSALSLFWPSLIIPSVFAEPIALELRRSTAPIFLNAQVFAGCMYLAGAICLWFVRAWKISELERAGADGDGNGVVSPEKREREIKDDDEVPKGANLGRTVSVAVSVKSKAKVAKGLWAWKRV